MEKPFLSVQNVNYQIGNDVHLALHQLAITLSLYCHYLELSASHYLHMYRSTNKLNDLVRNRLHISWRGKDFVLVF